ncbi:MAG: oxidoreductase, partial [Actinomycetales bacterium]|nr:oxidoreductase [Actinomycetales bacterium]
YRVLARAAATRALAGGRLRPEQAEALLDALAEPEGGPR